MTLEVRADIDHEKVLWSRKEKKCLLIRLLRSPSSSILQVDVQKGGRNTSPHQSSRVTTNPPTFHALTTLMASRITAAFGASHLPSPLSLSLNRDTIPTGERGRSDGNTEGGILCISFRQQACIFTFPTMFIFFFFFFFFLSGTLYSIHTLVCYINRETRRYKLLVAAPPVYDGVELCPS